MLSDTECLADGGNKIVRHGGVNSFMVLDPGRGGGASRRVVMVAGRRDALFHNLFIKTLGYHKDVLVTKY